MHHWTKPPQSYLSKELVKITMGLSYILTIGTKNKDIYN